MPSGLRWVKSEKQLCSNNWMRCNIDKTMSKMFNDNESVVRMYQEMLQQIKSFKQIFKIDKNKVLNIVRFGKNSRVFKF